MSAEEWRDYERANAKAKREYAANPAVEPFVPGHRPCMVCDVLTVQRIGVCLQCRRDPDVADLVANTSVKDMRKIHAAIMLEVKDGAA